MAKQVGNARVIGTADNLTGYDSIFGYIMRHKSSLTSKQFWKKKCFEGSRRSCKRFGEGNKLASFAYRNAPAENKEYELFLELKNIAIIHLKLDVDTITLRDWLQVYAETYVKKPALPKIKTRKPRPRMRHAFKQTGDYVVFRMKTLKWITEIYDNEQLKIMVHLALLPPKKRKARRFRPPEGALIHTRPVINLKGLQLA